tara:strand:- start:2152 stop:3480 length:1329 start_codon:yes stop_codon:yes gene_type:complete
MSTNTYPAKISKLHIFKLSIPIFFSNIAIPLVGIIDTGLMGHLSNEKYLIATSISSTVITLIFWSFGFLRMGTTGLIAQSLGKGDYREQPLIIIRNLIIALFISLIIIICQPLVIYFVTFFFQPSEDVLNLINDYISIRILSAPAEFCIYILVGFYLGIQKTFISSFIAILFSLLNIIFSIFFVNELNMNVKGVALGSLTASYISAIIFLVFTYFYIINKFKVIPKIQKNIINLKKIIKLFNINFDIFVRTLLLTFSFLWITYLSSLIGEKIIAINSILLQFIVISSFFLDAYAFSIEGIVGYNVGRRSQKSFLNAVKNSFQLSFFTGLIISIVFIIFSKDIINLITDLDILRFLSYKYIFWIVIIPPVASFCYQFDGIFVGATQTKEMRNAMLFTVIVYLALSYKLTLMFGNNGIWFALFLFMILRSATLFFFFPKILKKF